MAKLSPGQEYNVMVYRILNGSCSQEASINVTTRPSSVQNLTIENCTVDSLQIGWKPPRDPQSYTYTYCVCLIDCAIANESPFLAKGLKGGTMYTIEVRAVMKSNLHGDTMTINVITATLSLTHFHIQMINQTMAHFAWVNLYSPFSAIRLQWSPSDGSRGNETYPKPLNQAVLHGLTPSTNDTFTLFSTVGNGSLSRDSVGLQQHEATNQAWKNELNCSESVVIQELQPAKVYQIKIKTFWYNQYAVSDTVECSINTTEGQMPQRSRIQTWDFLESLVQYLCWLSHAIATRSCQTAPSALLLKTSNCRTRGQISSRVSPSSMKIKLRIAIATFCHCYSFALNLLLSAIFGPFSTNDHARVQLTLKEEDPYSDYINASYMPGCKKEKEFIAAQGPLPATLHDFWRMIREQRVTTIVMLTNCIENGRVKCEHYWPLDYTPCTYDDITVSVNTETILPDWSVRDFCIKQVSMSEVRHARHYHYTSWPDHGVPQTTDTILRFRDLVREDLDKMKDNGAVLVHCSAGVGRTGTFISLDSLLCEAQDQGEIGVFSFVEKLRRSRPIMIQNEDQYVFLHQCLLDGIQSASTNAGVIQENPAFYENILAMQGYEVSRV
ncbi:receptor-type tyrosine-protein phosphatase eta-like [Crotalus adamanteus]|uniref:protein-tyrosine-phosphatase n=1 Tax=Crotalus adamanteus TaxID=8729 RepID=A0AAW1B0E6_CROAD